MTHDDPKLTAYALDELHGDDLAAVEALLAHDESARRFVEETRQTVAMLTAGLSSVRPPGLTMAQRETIDAAAAKTAVPVAVAAPTLGYQGMSLGRQQLWARWALATAACAAIATAGVALVTHRPSPARLTILVDESIPMRVSDDPTSKPAPAFVSATPQSTSDFFNLKGQLGWSGRSMYDRSAAGWSAAPLPAVSSSNITLNNFDYSGYSFEYYGAPARAADIARPQALNYGNQPIDAFIRGTVAFNEGLTPIQPTDLSYVVVDSGQFGLLTQAGNGTHVQDLFGSAINGNVNVQAGGRFLLGDVNGVGVVSSGAGVAQAGNLTVVQGGADTSWKAMSGNRNGGVLAGYSTIQSGGRLLFDDGAITGTTRLYGSGMTNPLGGTGGITVLGGTSSILTGNAATGGLVVNSVNGVSEQGTFAGHINGNINYNRPWNIVRTGPVDLNQYSETVGNLSGTNSVPIASATPPAVALSQNSAPLPTVQLRRQTFAYDFESKLATAHDALARGDKETARAAVADANKLVGEQAVMLTVQEAAQARTAIKTMEAAIPNTESYAQINDNPFKAVAAEPLSTFSIDVDTASYSNIRRFLSEGQLPPPDAVRIEEMLNYFPYDYVKPKPDSKEPFAAAVEVAGCPWNSAHRLARVAIKGREIAHDKRPVSNLVFLIDVSGSMNEPKRLPMVKEGLKLMVNELTENDRIAIVVYAGNAGLVLPSTCADPKGKETILAAIENLSAGGSTNGGQGIELAYRLASDNFIKGGTNRVLLATDGDWNVGITDQESLVNLIQEKAKSGVFLSVLGYGFGNLKDSTMEKLADKGNGHYAYIDSLKESRKVLVEEMSSTLVTIAKDVKIQVEFNPTRVESYRLIGYEKRMLRKEDFNNDKVDAGEIGAGHCVTALYELTPVSRDPKGSAPATTNAAPQPDTDPLKYQKHEIVKSDDLMTLKLRYKQPDGETSTKIEIPATDAGLSYAKASTDFKFAAAVAQFGMILRNSPHKGTASLDGVIELADEGKGKDTKGYRGEFVELVKKAKAIVKQ